MTLPLFPQYMEPESTGPVVEFVVLFLNDWAQKERPDLKPAPFGRGMGGQATRLAYEFQRARGIPQDGGFGPVTRASANAAYGFDLEAIALTLPAEAEPTRFVQPDLEIFLWSPKNGTERDLEV